MRKYNRCSGNALIYVLIGIALIGFLTVSMTNQADQASSQDISDEEAELYVLELLEYMNSAKNVISQMETTGTDFNEFDFMRPTDSNFNTAPNIHKVYHPEGGGLIAEPIPDTNLPFLNDSGTTQEGWHFTNDINMEWTPSTADDLLISAYSVSQNICEQFNKKVVGNTTTPATASTHEDYILNNTDFDTTYCTSGCENNPMLCVENDSGDGWSIYAILIAR